MTLSRTQESQILDLHLSGFTQRHIAINTEVCLDSVNKRIQNFKQRGTVHLNKKDKRSRYNPMEEQTRKRIRFYLALEKRKTNYTVEQIYSFLIEEGFEISKSNTREWLRLERNRLKESYLDIHYEPGNMVQFDWGSKKISLYGRSQVVYFAVFALPFSNYRFVHVGHKMNSQAFLDAFISFSKHIGCVFPILLIDNMKIAVRYRSFKNNQVQLTDLFEQLNTHYHMQVRPCTPYKPNQKGTVENAVGTLKKELNGLRQDFQTLQQLQEAVNSVFNRLNNQRHPTKNDTCMNLMKHEQALAAPLPSKHLIYFQETEKKVMNNTLVSFDGNKYSAPEDYKGEKIIVQYNDRTVRLVSKTGKVLAKYSRCYGKGYKKYRVWNMLTKLQLKSNGFDQSKEKRQMPRWLKELYHYDFEKFSNEFFAFLELIRNVSKDQVKRLINYHRSYGIKLSLDSAIDFITKW